MRIDFTFHYGPQWHPVRLRHSTRTTNYQLPTSSVLDLTHFGPMWDLAQVQGVLFLSGRLPNKLLGIPWLTHRAGHSVHSWPSLYDLHGGHPWALMASISGGHSPALIATISGGHSQALIAAISGGHSLALIAARALTSPFSSTIRRALPVSVPLPAAGHSSPIWFYSGSPCGGDTPTLLTPTLL